MDGADHLRRAKAEMLEGDGEDRARLAAAALDVHAALIDEPAWPSELRELAAAVRASLPRPADMAEAVARMDDDAVRETANLLWALCLEAEGRLQFADPDPTEV